MSNEDLSHMTEDKLVNIHGRIQECVMDLCREYCKYGVSPLWDEQMHTYCKELNAVEQEINKR